MFGIRLTTDLNQVTENTVITKEGRETYLQFLQQHQSATPLVKLYGLKGADENDATKIKQHCKKLYKHLHPDKVTEEERDLCAKLFNLVHQAEEDTKKEPNATFIQGISPHTFLTPLDPCNRLWDCVHREKWLVGINILKTISLSLLKDNHQLSLLAYVIFIRTKQPQELKAYLEEKFPSIKKIMSLIIEENVQREITKKVAKERIDQLQQYLKEIRELQKRETEEYDQLFELMLPHFFFIQLKKYYHLLDDKLNWEISLREAIRRCPSFLEGEKRKLIAELKDFIQIYHTEFQEPLNVEKEMRIVAKNFTIEVSKQLGSLASLYNEYTYFNIKGEMELFEQSQNVCHINKAISYIETMLSLPFSFVTLLLNSFGCQFPSTETLTQWLNVLKGIKFYFQNDKNQAGVHFIKGNDFKGRGLMEFELHRYVDAINSFSQLNEKQIANGYIYHVLNFYDMLYLAEASDFQFQHIKEIDSIQKSAIKFFKETSFK